MKTETIIPAGRYFICDPGAYPELPNKAVISYNVPGGVYYSTSGCEVFVGESDSAESGDIGLIPFELVCGLDEYDEIDLSDNSVTFESDSVCYIDETGFGFGPAVFENCLGLDDW